MNNLGKIIIGIISVFIVCCKTKNEMNIAIFPSDENHFTYKNKNIVVEDLNLINLENGIQKDSLIIRLWQMQTWSNLQIMYTLKFNKNNYKGNIYFYYLNNNKVDSCKVFNVENSKLTINWVEFLDDLSNSEIYNIQTQTSLKGFQYQHADGDVFAIEIYTKNKYRFYQYACPTFYVKDYPETEKFIKVLEVFKKHLKVNYDC